MSPSVVCDHSQVVYGITKTRNRELAYSMTLGHVKERNKTYGHAGDSTELLVHTIVELNVGETFDARSTSPSPVIYPCNRSITVRRDRRAGLARGSTACAPLVEEYFVFRSTVDGVPRTAILRSVEPFQGYGQRDTSGKNGGEEREEHGVNGNGFDEPTFD